MSYVFFFDLLLKDPQWAEQVTCRVTPIGCVQSSDKEMLISWICNVNQESASMEALIV